MKTLLLSNQQRKISDSQTFLKCSDPDFILIAQNKIYPLHRELLTQSSYFRKNLKDNKKVHILESTIQGALAEFDDLIFVAVLGYLYGIDIITERNSQIGEILRVTKILGISDLEQKIFVDFQENFDQYGIFNLMQIASTFNLVWLEKKCFYELVQLQYEHIWINRFDLLQCQKTLFQRILVEFLGLVSEMRLKCSSYQLNKLVEEYNGLNKENIDLKNLQTKVQKTGASIKKKQSSRKYSYPPLREECLNDVEKIDFVKFEEKQKLQKLELEEHSPSKSQIFEQDLNENSNSKSSSENTKRGEVIRLRKINSDMIKSSNDLRQELDEMKVELYSHCSSSTEDDIESLFVRCQQIKKISDINDKKIANLKRKMSKYSEEMNDSYFESRIQRSLPDESSSFNKTLSPGAKIMRKSTGPYM